MILLNVLLELLGDCCIRVYRSCALPALSHAVLHCCITFRINASELRLMTTIVALLWQLYIGKVRGHFPSTVESVCVCVCVWGGGGGLPLLPTLFLCPWPYC